MAKHPHKAPAAADTASPDTNLPHQVCTFARRKYTIYKSAKLRLAPITPNLRSDLNRIGALVVMKFTLSKMARNLQVLLVLQNSGLIALSLRDSLSNNESWKPH